MHLLRTVLRHQPPCMLFSSRCCGAQPLRSCGGQQLCACNLPHAALLLYQTSPPCCRPLQHPVTVVDREVTVDDLKPMNDGRNHHEVWYQVRAWPDRL